MRNAGEVGIRRTTVKSSAVKEVGYDQVTLTLEVVFHNGSVYQYFGIPQRIYDGLIAADSVGLFLNQNVKDQFRYEKKS